MHNTSFSILRSLIRSHSIFLLLFFSFSSSFSYLPNWKRRNEKEIRCSSGMHTIMNGMKTMKEIFDFFSHFNLFSQIPLFVYPLSTPSWCQNNWYVMKTTRFFLFFHLFCLLAFIFFISFHTNIRMKFYPIPMATIS